MVTIAQPFKEARRENRGLLAAAEKRGLLWLAGRMPRSINSDHLTTLGLVAMLGVGLSYWYASRHPLGLVVASLLLVVNWFGDSLDGTLARVRNCQRPRYGFYVDHIVDALGILAIIGGLGLSGYMSWLVALTFLVAYFLLAIDGYLATYTIGAFRLAYCKLGPTELRILLAVGNVAD